MSTSSIHVSPRFEVFHECAPNQDIRYTVVPHRFLETCATAALRQSLFERRTMEVKEILEKQGTRCEVAKLEKPLPGQAPLVLYKIEGGQRQKVAFDGKTYGFLGYVLEKDTVLVNLTEIFYSHVIASAYPEYAELRAQEQLPDMPAGVGICCAIESSDGKVLLTERSAGALAHPSFLHTMGGNIDVTATARETIMEEMTEELGLVRGTHFYPQDLRLVALGADPHYEDGPCTRPEIIFYARLALSWEEMAAIFAHKNQHEVDCATIQPCVLDKTFPQRFKELKNHLIPSGEASLAYAWKFHQDRAETA